MSAAPEPLPPFSVPPFHEPGARRIDLNDRPPAESLTSVLQTGPFPAPQVAASAPPPPEAVRPKAARYDTLTFAGALGLALSLVQAGRVVWALVRHAVVDVVSSPSALLPLLPTAASAASAFVLALGLIAFRPWAHRLALAMTGAGAAWLVARGAALLWEMLRHRRLEALDWSQIVSLACGLGLALLVMLLLADADVARTCAEESPGPSWTDPVAPPALLAAALTLTLACHLATLAGGVPFPAWGRFLAGEAHWLWLVAAGGLAVAGIGALHGRIPGRVLLVFSWIGWFLGVTVSSMHNRAAASAMWARWGFGVPAGLTFATVLLCLALPLCLSRRPDRG